MQVLSMAAQSSNPANATVSLSQKLNKFIADGSRDYNSWRTLILEIETETPEDINTISLAYDSFLSMFPLCHWHLEKYAHHKAKLCGPQEAVNIYERGVRVAMYSVGFWVDYFTFGATCFGDPEDVRRLFRRAFSFVDKDYFCHALWDKYVKYEFDLEGWSFLAHSYIQALRFPTKKLEFYYDNFKQFVANLAEEMGYENDDGILVHYAAKEISTNEISFIIKDLLDSSDKSVRSKALDRYKSIGEEFYQEARVMDEKIKCFEKKIRRQYFYATPLDDDQLDNWHLYLDFIEKQDNMNWAMKLYERCLIPCANYPEFWMRYVEFLESKGGRELAISALYRATQIFLKNVPEIHLFNARFKEHIGDVSGARAALTFCDTKTDSSFIENAVTLANLERRLGKFAAASAIYKKALKDAKEKRKMHVLPSLYFHFAQLTFLTTGSAAAARDVLIEGVRNVPHCRFLLEELIKFAMTHEGASQVNIIDRIINDAISTGFDEYQGLNAKDREDISNLFLEFANLCGTIHDIRNAWNRHIKLFPQCLRMKTTYNLSTSGDYSIIDLETDQKGKNKLPPQQNHKTAQMQSTKTVNLSNQDASQDDRPAHEIRKSMETTNINSDIDPSEIEHTQDQNQHFYQEDKEPDEGGPTKITSLTSQQPWQAEAMNQMLYHYHQQQYQQQLHMQNAYSQMQFNYFNHPAYQMPPHQQHAEQQIPSNQQSQQDNHQSGDISYQAYQLAYQQGQQMLLQQYQQYQGYQYPPRQQQSNEGPSLMQEQHNSTQNLSQNQQGCKKAPLEYDGTGGSSESLHRKAKSPQVLE